MIRAPSALALALVAPLGCGHVDVTRGGAPAEPVDSGSSVVGDGGMTADGAEAEGAPDSGDADSGPPGFVQVAGTGLVDGAGQPLLLRAMDLGDWFLPEGYMWGFSGPRGDRARRIEQRVQELIGATAAAAFWQAWRDTFVTEDDIARMHDLGFNAVRVALSARMLMPEGQTAFDEAGFGYVERLVKWCRAHGVYVVFDMHAAPGGQTGTNIDDDINDQPELFTTPDDQTRLTTLWTEIARRYAASTTVVGYDLLNEPIAPMFSSFNAQLWPTYQRLGAAIRSVDGHHILIVEGAAWANDWSTLGAPFDPQLVYSFHKYWDDPSVGSIQGYLDGRAKWNRPLWAGEIGENDPTWYKAAFPMLEKSNVGWGFWTWKKLGSTNNPYGIPVPSQWDAVVAYVNDPSQVPAPGVAQAALDELRQSIPLARCTYNKDSVCAVVPCP
jgi:hypothetical protein